MKNINGYKDFLLGFAHSMISCFGVVILSQLFIRLLFLVSTTSLMCNICANIAIFGFTIPVITECFVVMSWKSEKEECKLNRALGASIGMIIYFILVACFVNLVI